MGLLSSSSSRQVSNVTEYNFANYGGESSGGGGGPFNLAGINLSASRSGTANLSIETSDYGAISGALDLSKLALEKGSAAYTEGLAAFGASTDKVLSRAMNIAQANQTPEGSQLLDTIKQIAIGVAIAFVVATFAKKG